MISPFDRSKADVICDRFRADPYAKITDIARELNTSRSQVRRVLKRAGMYGNLKRRQLVIPAPKYTKNITEVEFFLCDLHIPYHDPVACGIAYREMLDLQPDRIYIGGDLLDFHKISYFNKDPEAMDMADEIDKAKDFLWQLQEDFPEAKITLEGGNHVSGRWENYMCGTNVKGVEGVDIDSILGLDEFNISYVSALEEKQMTGRFPKHGKLFHLHGDEARVHFGGVNIARTMFLRLRYNAIFGHFHKTQEYYDKDVADNVMACWSVGCLCNLTPAFRPVNDWNHGFAIVYYHEDGTFSVENKKIIEGMVV